MNKKSDKNNREICLNFILKFRMTKIKYKNLYIPKQIQ